MIVGYINGQELSLSTQPVASDTINYLEMQLNFRQAADWAGLDIWAHFAQKDAVYDIHAPGGRILREQGLNLSAGEWSVYVHGNAIVDGEPVLRITAGPAVLRVRPVGMLQGEPFPTIPPSAGEQIIAEARGVLEEVRAAGEKAVADVGSAADAAMDRLDAVDAVRADVPQVFTETQQKQARTNIRAASTEDVSKLSEAISDKLDADKLPETINTALAQAKESGKFDGAPGISPHIGDNGNWFVGNKDTGVQAQGDDYVLTAQDKAEIAGIVLSELPKYNGEVEDV